MQLSGADATTAKQLERFTTPEDLGRAYFEAQNRIRAGDLLKPLPEEATEEDTAAYREQLGIPAEAAGYLSDTPEGLVIGEDDKAMFDSFAEAMHEMNVPPAIVHKSIEWYNGLQEQQDAQMQELDAADKQVMEDTMRSEWGTDYRANVNIANAFLDSTFPEEAVDAFKNARGPDGGALVNNPEIMRGLVQVGRMMNPGAGILPPGTVDLGKGIDDRIKEIEGIMSTDRKAYNKDQKMQDELTELYGARLKRDANAA